MKDGEVKVRCDVDDDGDDGDDGDDDDVLCCAVMWTKAMVGLAFGNLLIIGVCLGQ